MAKKSFPIRIEEMPVLGKFLQDSFLRDFADFQGYSPDFNNAYKTNFAAKLTAVEGIVNPIKIMAELKKITERLYENIDSLRPLLNKLEGYVNRADDNLSILPGDFGIKPVRDKISNKDQEGLSENLKVLLQNVDDNFTALSAKGFTAAAQTVLINLRDSINTDNEAQNVKMDEREAKVQENYDVLIELWEIMSDVMDAGRVRLYKFTDKEKAGDYTLATLKNRIRQEKKKGGGVSIPQLPQ